MSKSLQKLSVSAHFHWYVINHAGASPYTALVSHTLGLVSSKFDALWNYSTIQNKVATLAMSAFMGGKKPLNMNSLIIIQKIYQRNTPICSTKFHYEPSRPWLFPLTSTTTAIVSSSSMTSVFKLLVNT